MQLPVPVIGAVNGIAVAGGLEMLLCCDFLLASDSARMGDGHAKFGVLPAGGATVRLTERIGPSRAAQLFYSAEMIDAPTALNWGLVNELLPPENLLDRAKNLALKISKNSPDAIRKIKQITNPKYDKQDRQSRLRKEISTFAAHLESEELKEGLSAFGEKRQPNYR